MNQWVLSMFTVLAIWIIENVMVKKEFVEGILRKDDIFLWRAEEKYKNSKNSVKKPGGILSCDKCSQLQVWCSIE